MGEPCLWHHASGLGYIAKSDDADRRMAAGEKQRQCPDCHLWWWPHEYAEQVK